MAKIRERSFREKVGWTAGAATPFTTVLEAGVAVKPMLLLVGTLAPAAGVGALFGMAVGAVCGGIWGYRYDKKDRFRCAVFGAVFGAAAFAVTGAGLFAGVATGVALGTAAGFAAAVAAANAIFVIASMSVFMAGLCVGTFMLAPLCGLAIELAKKATPAVRAAIRRESRPASQPVSVPQQQ